MGLQTSSIAWNEVDDRLVVLDLATSTYFSANASGTLLWKLMASGADRSALISALVERFAIDRRTAEDDVSAFLSELQRAKLLEPGS
jgi:hypothetical protein